MIKSNKDFVPKIAEEYQLEDKEVSNILDFFFKDLKTKLETMVDIDIYVYGLGTFSAKRKKIYDLILYFEAKKRKVNESQKLTGAYKQKVTDECDQRINQLHILKDKYKRQDEKKKELKREQTDTTRSIQEPQSDMGRIEE